MNSLIKDDRIKEAIIGTTWDTAEMIDSENNIIKINQLIFNNSLLKTIKRYTIFWKESIFNRTIQTPEYGNNFCL